MSRRLRPSTVMHAWRRETLAELSQTLESGSRPIRLSPSTRPKVLSPRISQQRVVAVTAVARRLLGGITAKGIANPVDRADETRALRIVAKRLAYLADQHVQAAVDDECVRPEPLVEFGLLDDLRPRLDQAPTGDRTPWATNGTPSVRAATDAYRGRRRTDRTRLSPLCSKPNKSLRISFRLGSRPGGIVLEMILAATSAFCLHAKDAAQRNTWRTAAYTEPMCPDPRGDEMTDSLLPRSAMPPHRTGAGASGPRRPARDIIEAVVENMRKNLEPLKYSTLAPSRYVVYLHPSEYSRLDGIIRSSRNRRRERWPRSSNG